MMIIVFGLFHGYTFLSLAVHCNGHGCVDNVIFLGIFASSL
uniref:Uncharacterized protein n=1 Tax=Nelumbo nucifera TaxID=4432 RepID=A0A822XR04_NELNU|nr:TPA_asm: hypothetical protein HUJ06_023566 [Nelumbo nucifera]